MAGLFAGLPGAGATMRTVINARSGGRTPLFGAIHGLVLLAVILGLEPLAARIPLAVLAGILVTVGIGIVDYRSLSHLPHAPRSDAAVMLLVLALTVFVDLMTAVGVGVVLACLLFVQRMSRLGLGRVLRLEDLEADWADEQGLPRTWSRRPAAARRRCSSRASRTAFLSAVGRIMRGLVCHGRTRSHSRASAG